MMTSQVYLDSNVLVYAFCEQADTESKQQASVKIITDLLKAGNLCLSNLVICEFAYILNRLKEDNNKIKNSTELLSQFVKTPEKPVTQRLLEIINPLSLYKNSFDCYHLAFAENTNCSKLITFDKDFNKFKPISKIEIQILKSNN